MWKISKNKKILHRQLELIAEDSNGAVGSELSNHSIAMCNICKTLICYSSILPFCMLCFCVTAYSVIGFLIRIKKLFRTKA